MSHQKSLFTAALAVAVLLASPWSAASEPPAPAALRQLHQGILRTLSAEQAAVLSAQQPPLLLVSSCPVHLGDVNRDERILGAFQGDPADQARTVPAPAALVWENGKWALHLLNADIARDAWGREPIQWEFGVAAATVKCGIDPYQDADLTEKKGQLLEHQRVYFSLDKKAALAKPAVCFGTSDTYNNWDCVLFSQKNRRFSLWYRQEYAD